ncbi:MAG: hypothetical protein ABIY55_34115 [Kofleriaceae bacterium]
MRLIAACLVLTGCFYIDPINARPRIEPIQCRNTSVDRPCANDGYLHRSDQIELSTTVVDPDGAAARATYAWSAFACSDADAVQCDSPAYFESAMPKPIIAWPVRASGVRSIRVDLDVRDDRGALVTQSAKFFANDPPTLEVHTSQHPHAIGAPLQLTATYGDPDEGSTNIRLDWSVVVPVLDPVATLDDVAVASGDAGQRTVAKRLVPTAVGAWDVQVVATDALGETNRQQLRFDVGPDQAPCLTRVQPIVPPDGALLPIVEPTAFQVPLVDDELDAYPRLSGDPVFGTTTFAWSILPPPPAVRQLLVGATGNSLDFDPRSFAPGQIVELRVEIFDRNHSTISCGDAAPTCASVARPRCSQRQTWRMEIR